MTERRQQGRLNVEWQERESKQCLVVYSDLWNVIGRWVLFRENKAIIGTDFFQRYMKPSLFLCFVSLLDRLLPFYIKKEKS